MMRHVYKQVGTKFDSDAQFKAIGGYLILRGINLSLILPNQFGICEKISENAQKELTNISKIVQNLANETAPSQKNQYLAPFDDFVEQEILEIRNFYNSIIIQEPKPIESQSSLQVPHDVEPLNVAKIIIYSDYFTNIIYFWVC